MKNLIKPETTLKFIFQIALVLTGILYSILGRATEYEYPVPADTIKFGSLTNSVIQRQFLVRNFSHSFRTRNCPQNLSKKVKFKSGYVHVNGIRLFYKEAGEGDPILFLHGGFGTSDMHFQQQFEEFSKQNRIITFDTRGHGKSEFDNHRFTYELFADDTYGFLEALDIDSVTVVGFSDGGITGIILASQHPEKVKNLVIIGANSVPDTTAFYPSAIEWVRNLDIQQMVGQVKSAFPAYPAPEKLTEFVERMQTLWLEEPNLTDSDLNKISCPVLIVAGDNDSIKIEHQAYLHRNIPNSALLILPNTGHEAHVEREDIVNQLIFEMLEDENH